MHGLQTIKRLNSPEGLKEREKETTQEKKETKGLRVFGLLITKEKK